MRLVVVVASLTSTAAFAADSVAGLQWTPPTAWPSQGERPMRAATYAIPATKADKEPAELAVFYFGPGQGGSVPANIERWIGQFEQPDGSPSKAKATVKEEKAGKFPLTIIELPGTYLASGGPMMGAPKEKKAAYRLLGAIVEGPQGAVFFKLTGPDKTVSAAKAEFLKMVKGIKPADAK